MDHKGRGDFHSAQREYRARKNPNYDALCFHSQQCVEKYLKARLQEADIPFGRIHDLAVLLDAVLVVEPLWEFMRSQLRLLSIFAVEYRYPGQFADLDTSKQAFAICKSVRNTIRQNMGLV